MSTSSGRHYHSATHLGGTTFVGDRIKSRVQITTDASPTWRPKPSSQGSCALDVRSVITAKEDDDLEEYGSCACYDPTLNQTQREYEGYPSPASSITITTSPTTSIFSPPPYPFIGPSPSPSPLPRPKPINAANSTLWYHPPLTAVPLSPRRRRRLCCTAKDLVDEIERMYTRSTTVHSAYTAEPGGLEELAGHRDAVVRRIRTTKRWA